MTGKITIENLRNIAFLEFDLPDRGTWLLTAGNGAGKTSLLACIRRLGYPNAFPVHFPSSMESGSLDNFENTKIVYEVNAEAVEYAYRGERWAPRPRKNSHLLSKFGYPSVIYIGANADRITPRPEDFVPKRVKPASANIIAAANRIFETKKFDELKIINITKGGGNIAFLLRIAQNPVQYHSEKQFSLGELCILKLIRQLQDCPQQSLVLIDELEMALHPRAQIQLFKYLDEIAANKKLTIIFSTHSVSLLKTIPRKRIIYLERDDKGSVTPVVGCFPTYAIGNITLGEERAPDVVLYVEDEMARALVETLVDLTKQKKFSQGSLFPTVKVIPIGPFESVVNFLSQHTSVLPTGTKSYAFLDADVKDENVKQWEANQNFAQLKKYNDLEQKINYLPWSPEVGVINYLNTDRSNAEKEIREYFADPQLVLDQNLFSGLANLQGSVLRQKSKNLLDDICSNIAGCTTKSVDDVKREICKIFAKNYFVNNKAAMLTLLGSKLN